LVTVPDRCAALRQQRAERELTAKVSALAHERRQLEQSMQARACLQFCLHQLGRLRAALRRAASSLRTARLRAVQRRD
jgi:hypothetical protein